MPLTVNQASRVLELLLDGMSLRAALKDCKISPREFQDYLSTNPSFEKAYAHARIIGSDLNADDVIEIADNETDPQRARNRIDARKWHASKMNPQKYGDRIDLNVNGSIDLNAALLEATKRVLPMRDQPNISDAELVDTKALSDKSTTDNQSVDPLKTDLAEKQPIDIFS